ncbi:MAG TPA: YcxB family protein [Erysipelotrichaceae bacterium]|nr:YcxB family protein [Erysipelotrichaceae bacterium]HQB32294.1 YcxB family protein [Erysipelotrichaceae bacterium]
MKIIFKLEKEDYLEYLRFIIANSRKNRITGWWLRVIIPLLLLFTFIFFKLYTNTLYVVAALAFAVFWFLFLSDRIWKAFLFRSINMNFVQKMNIVDFAKVTVDFKESNITVDGKTIEYRDVEKIIPLKNILAIFYGGANSFVIPNKAIGNMDQQTELIGFIYEKIAEDLAVSS